MYNISAKEAKEASNAVVKNDLTSELNEVMKLISKAIDNGLYKVFLINRTLRNDTKDMLLQLEYVVETGGRYNEIDTVIKWD